MNFTLEEINNERFLLYERASTSRKATGFSVYTRCCYRSWSDLDEQRKMQLMKPALRGTIIARLEDTGFLPNNFDRQNGAPFLIAPFSSFDLKGDLRTVVCHWWKLMDADRKEAWNRRAGRLNARPVSGKFQVLPLTLFDDFHSSDAVVRSVLVRDFQSTILQFNKCFEKLEQSATIYKKIEHVYLRVPVNHKFYFYKPIPSIVMDSLFGNPFKKFTEEEQVSKKKNKNTFTYHVFTAERTKAILSVSDVDLSQYRSYKLLEIKHNLCSYATVKSTQEDQFNTSMNCYGIDNVRGKIRFITNNQDDSATINILFNPPILEERIESRDVAGHALKVTHVYRFLNQGISACGNFRMTYFWPVIFQLNKNKLTLKLIASRCCRDSDTNVINKTYSSAK